MVAQETLTLLNSALGEALHPYGFRGANRRFWRRLPQVWQAMWIQPRRLDPDEGAEDRKVQVAFTADIGVASLALLSAEGRDKERVPARGTWHREVRIGAFLPVPYDRWWVAPANGEPEAMKVIQDFVSSVLTFALPALDSLDSDVKLRGVWLLEAQFLSPPERVWLQELIRTTNLGSGGPSTRTEEDRRNADAGDPR